MKYFLSTFCLLILLTPAIAASQYTPLVNIPQLNNGSGDGFNGYINAIYAMFISIAALLAVVKIIVAGVKYMFSDIVTQKSQAKKDIQGALLGLLVVLAAVLILTVINPNLTNFNLEYEALDAPINQGTSSSNTLDSAASRNISCDCVSDRCRNGAGTYQCNPSLCTSEGGLPVGAELSKKAYSCLYPNAQNYECTQNEPASGRNQFSVSYNCPSEESVCVDGLAETDANAGLIICYKGILP